MVGRYWTVGPQLTLYIRSAFLVRGENELVVFETIGGDFSKVSFDDQPQLDIPPSPINDRRKPIKRQFRRY
jgi:beta-galactosidase